MARAPGNSKYVRKLNRMSVLNLIKEQEPISRRQLAGITGLTPPAITGIIRELLDVGLVVEEGLGLSEGGRKPVKLRFNPTSGYVIGVEVTRFECTIGIADLKNHPTGIYQAQIDMTEPAQGMPLLVAALKKTVDEEKRQGKKIIGMGVAFPGLINASEGIVTRSVNLGPAWKKFPLRERLQQEMELATVVENNSNASALAERWFGGGLDSPDLVYVNLGEGISAGVILDDRILQGFQGHAGEIGHIVMLEGGPLCNCGNRGCLEAICGIPALLRRAGEQSADGRQEEQLRRKKKLSLEELLLSAETEGSFAWKMMQETGYYVGLAIADVINLYNPRTIFVGGPLSAAAPAFLKILEDTARSHAFPDMAGAAQIRVSALGGRAGVIGACALALRDILKSLQSPLFDKD